GELLDEAEMAVAGVVDHDVEAAEVVVCPLDRGEVGGAVGDVQRHGQHRVAEPVPQIVEGGDVAGGGRHPVAAVQRRDRPFPAETARCPGDEPDLRAPDVRTHALPSVASALCSLSMPTGRISCGTLTR